MCDGQHVVVHVGQGRVPPQEGSLWSDVEGCQFCRHVHGYAYTKKSALKLWTFLCKKGKREQFWNQRRLKIWYENDYDEKWKSHEH